MVTEKKWHILILVCTFGQILYLQVELDDDNGRNDAYDISNECCDAVNGGICAVRQVSNFMSDDFVLNLF